MSLDVTSTHTRGLDTRLTLQKVGPDGVVRQQVHGLLPDVPDGCQTGTETRIEGQPSIVSPLFGAAKGPVQRPGPRHETLVGSRDTLRLLDEGVLVAFAQVKSGPEGRVVSLVVPLEVKVTPR